MDDRGLGEQRQRSHHREPDAILDAVGEHRMMLQPEALFVERAERHAGERTHRAKRARQRAQADLGAGDDDDDGSAQPQKQTDPALEIDLFGDKTVRQETNQDRLQADDQGEAAGRGAEPEAEIGQPEVEDLDAEAGHRQVAIGAKARGIGGRMTAMRPASTTITRA